MTADASAGLPAAWAKAVGLDLCACGAAGLLFAFAGTLLWGDLSAFLLSLDFPRTFFRDFLLWYYKQGQMIFELDEPVPNYLYTAFFAVILAVFKDVPLGTARDAWGAVQVVSLPLYAVAANALVFGRRLTWHRVWAPLLIVVSMPVWHNFLWGQVSGMMTLATVAALIAQQRGCSGIAGTVIGVAASVKYYPAVLVGFFIAERDKRAVAAFAVAALLAFAFVPAVAMGPGAWWSFTLSVTQEVAGREYHAATNSLYVPHVLLRLANASDATREAWLPALRASGIAVFLLHVGGVAAAVRWKLPRDARALFAFCLLQLTLCFVIRTSWPHYFTFLPLAQLSAGVLVLTNFPNRAARWGLVGLVSASVFASSLVLFGLLEDYKVMGHDGYLALSSVLKLLVVDVTLLWGGKRRLFCCRRQRPGSRATAQG